ATLYPQQRKRSSGPREHNITGKEFVEYWLPGNEADILFSILCPEHLFRTVRLVVLDKAKRYCSYSITRSVFDATLLIRLFRNDQAPSRFRLKRLCKIQVRDNFGVDSKLCRQFRDHRLIDCRRSWMRLRFDHASEEYQHGGTDRRAFGIHNQIFSKRCPE